VKRSFSILLVATFLVYFAGFYIYFILRLTEIRSEMRSQMRALPKEQLHQLILSPADFEKSKVEDDEIKVDGKMYDIAWVETTNKEVTVYCLHDEAEDNLLSFLDEILKNASNDKKQLPSGIFSLLEMDVLPKILNTSSKDVALQKGFTAYKCYVNDFIPLLNTPPPRNA
jgi:hypothetical protein